MDLREVNLVPESVLRGHYAYRHVVAWALAYGVAGVVLVGGFLAYSRVAVQTHRMPASVEDVRGCLEAAVAAIESMKDELERLAFVRDLSPRLGAAEVLSRLAEGMDPGTWLTNLSLDRQDAKRTLLVMEGHASSNARLGSTIKGISADKRFRDVRLLNSSEERQESGAEDVQQSVVQFSVEAVAETE